MYSVNSVVVEGIVAGECKVFAEKEGLPVVAQIQIKHTKLFKDKAIASWFSIKGYGQFAELVCSCKEGDHVLVYGVLKQERYKSKTGQSVANVVVEPFKILLVSDFVSDKMSDDEGNNNSAVADEQGEENLGF